jgi:hypothetical protein
MMMMMMMMEAVRTSETSVDNYFTRQCIPEDNSEHHTRRRENLKSRIDSLVTKSEIKLGSYLCKAMDAFVDEGVVS